MNLYGHATVAGWAERDARFVLGAMLPDLGKLAGHRRLVARAPAAIAGIAWHHRTDDAFHTSRAFTGLCRDAHARFENDGVPRGPAMAVAHVALELFIDGVLLADLDGRTAYLEAIAIDPGALELADARSCGDVERVLARMRAVGLPEHYRDPERVAGRVVAILEHRPRLAVPRDRIAAIVAWAHDVAPVVARAVPDLVLELRAALITST